MSNTTVLGVDLGPSAWANNGSAVITFDAAGPAWRSVECAVIDWPTSLALTPESIAQAIDEFARANKIAAVSIDGPQGWRDPNAPTNRPGVGRACEYSARTPGKTGTNGTVFPGNQLGWIRFSIELFDLLLSLPHTRLANDPAEPPLEHPPSGGYVVLECFPTSTWRSSGLVPLPGKTKKADLAEFANRLLTAYDLPPLRPIPGHDDLQALVAALAAAAVFGAGRAIAHGEPAQVLSEKATTLRVEGLIWDAAPPAEPFAQPSTSRSDETLLRELERGQLFRFADWPNASVPRIAAGAYTIWRGDELIYVGMAGRSLTSSRVAELRAGKSAGTGLFSRLGSHASGRRSGDQFCVYVADRILLTELDANDQQAISRAELSFDGLIREFVAQELTYRFVESDDAAQARRLETLARRGALDAGRPLLNPS